MKCQYLAKIILPLFLFFYGECIHAQSWEFVKEEDGIKLYTRKEMHSLLKAYKGEVTIHVGMDKMNLLVGDPNNTDWWTRDFKEIKMLESRKNKYIKYHIVFSIPWPLANRDLVLEERISTDPVSGARIVEEKPLYNVMPERPDMVRIKTYWQKWTILPIDNGSVHVILEGLVDPNGNVPLWLSSMVITETPLKVLRSLRERALSDQPVIN